MHKNALKDAYSNGFFDGLDRKYSNEFPPGTIQHAEYEEGYKDGYLNNRFKVKIKPK